MTYSSVVLADNPIAYYRLGESSGVVVDTIGGTSGTVNGSPTRDVSGATSDGDGGIDFNGTATVTVLHQSQFNVGDSITIEAWVKFDATGAGYQSVLAKHPGVDTNGEYAFSWERSTGKIVLYVYNASWFRRVESTANAVVAGSWYHVVVTKVSTTTVKIWVNAVDVTLTTSGTATIINNSANITIGGFTPSAEQCDQVDEVAIYSGALAGGRITAHYNAAIEVTAGDVTLGDALRDGLSIGDVNANDVTVSDR